MKTNEKNVILLAEEELNSLRGGVSSAYVISEDTSTSEEDGGFGCCNGKGKDKEQPKKEL